MSISAEAYTMKGLVKNDGFAEARNLQYSGWKIRHKLHGEFKSLGRLAL